ncbi:sugar ABC transporter ATP-binding protein [Salisediminibacterium selenitireducens]|uniref:ABC transporter related protein n=1 Tax=Bacillus selenitireducens (strain ATCC 700615 / DSM 15326 / MLS10) TaxID=439292 RepID=D6XZQ9_BACIE|nr:sugar ABC transporter ATP-binding protein [Salisediminibacterium selenitireducens]ADH98433.1 ABC transporter related protein [[Bacillus] selenitireducens MLS10]
MIRMSGINKSFSANHVLKDVEFELQGGEIHALMGENGAGKSTLMKILSGVYSRDSGEIEVNGKAVEYRHPKEAEKDGIAVIHQELNILPELTVAENLFLGKEMKAGPFGWLKTGEMNRKAAEQLSALGLDVDPATLAKHLSVGKQQLIEIAKSLMSNAKVIIMDEPTAALTGREIETLFDTIMELKGRGVSFVYISHRMEEIFRICDRITVLRDGVYTGTRATSDTTFDEIVSLMVGRELGERFPRVAHELGDVILQAKGYSLEGEFQGIDFDLKKGEILGIAGLMGAGRSELVETLFGYRRRTEGELIIEGKPVSFQSPQEAMMHGLGFVSEDRKSKGLIVDFSIKDNLNVTNLSGLSRYGWMQNDEETALYNDMKDKLGIRAFGKDQLVKSLSGGNQQKVVIAKWLATSPKILILDEPTRGVDIGAKKEIYQIISELSEAGVSIIMVSSELPEIIGMSDRVMVMCEGRLTGILSRDELNEERIMHFATGGDKYVQK